MKSTRQTRSTRANPIKRNSAPKGKNAKSKKDPLTVTLNEINHPRRRNAPIPVPSLSNKTGKIYVCGNGDCGQLGLGPDTFERKSPVIPPVIAEMNFCQISSGGLHNLGLTVDGKLYSWGCNDQKALGRDGEEFEPGLVQGLDNVVIVKAVCGDSVSVALSSKGKVYTWGTYRGPDGILGFSAKVKIQATPVIIEPLAGETIVDIAAGVDHVLALDNKGKVHCWGNGHQHQLGRRLTERIRLNSLHPVRLSLRNIVRIGCGAYNSFAVDQEGQVFTWGLNNFGQCGIFGKEVIPYPECIEQLSSSETAPVVQICGGEHHSLALLGDGQVYAFGRSDSSQLGLGYTTLESEEAAIAATLSEEQKKEKTHKKCISRPQHVRSLSNVAEICCGSNHNLAVNEEGHLYSWGFGELYQLGNGKDDNDVEVPTRVTTKSLADVKVYHVSAGGQHSVMIGRK